MIATNKDWFYSSNEFQSFFKSSNRSIIIKADAPAYTIMAASDNYLRLTHRNKEDLLGKHFFDIFPGNATIAAQKDSLLDSFERVIETGQTDTIPVYQYQVTLPDTGEIVTQYWSNTNEAVLDEDGNTAYIIRTVTNISDKLQIEKALEEAAKQQAALLREQALNEELAVTVEELRVTNEELHHTQEMLHQLTKNLEERVAERTQNLSDSERNLRITNDELTVSNQALTQSQQTQKRAEAIMSLAVEAANMGVWYINAETREFNASPRLKELFGFYPTDVVTLAEAIAQITEDHRNFVTQAVEKAITEGGNYDVSYKVRGYHDQQIRWVRAVGNLAVDISGEFSAFTGVITDITEQVAARIALEGINEELAAANEEQMAINEELSESQHELAVLNAELEESKARFLTLIEQAPVAIALFKTNDLIIDFVNEDMLAIWGKTPGVQGKPLSVAMPELDGQPFEKILQDTLTSGESYYGSESWAQVVRNGELVEGYFNFICQPIRDGSGAITGVLQVVTEITEQVAARQQIERTQQEYYQALDSADLGTWSLSVSEQQFKMSARSRQIFGLPLEGEVEYEHAIAAVDEEYKTLIAEAVANGLTNNASCDIQYSINNLVSSEKKWIRVTGKMFYNHAGKPDCFSGVIMDITEQKQDEQRKSDFIGMVSHEMKTPLTSLNGYLQILQTKMNSEDTFSVGMLGKANKQVGKMTTMINGFLNVSRLQSGKIHIEKQRFNMAELVKEAEEEVRSTINSHKVVFAPVETTWVLADRDKIGQVINNLVSNAVKYSPANTIINVGCITVDNCAAVSVKDEGIGIKEDDKSKLFDRYYRVNNDNAKSVSGFGIGLYLCAEIIQRHDGKIWVESEVGKGSTFSFLLPVIE